jgi:hypothetical protein
MLKLLKNYQAKISEEPELGLGLQLGLWLIIDLKKKILNICIPNMFFFKLIYKNSFFRR